MTAATPRKRTDFNPGDGKETNVKMYLGDSVYLEFDEPDGDEVVLTTENGFPEDPSNRIVLSPEMVAMLNVIVHKPVMDDTPADDVDEEAEDAYREHTNPYGGKA